MRLSATSASEKDDVQVVFEASDKAVKDGATLTLHWGVLRGDDVDWSMPPESMWPKGSTPFGDGKAIRSELDADGRLAILVPRSLVLSVDDDDDDNDDEDDVESLHEEEKKEAARGVGGAEKGGITQVVGVMVRNGEEWLHDAGGGGDFSLKLSSDPAGGNAKALIRRMAKEESAESVNLFRRFCVANELLEPAMAAGEHGAGAMLAWLRLSANKKLKWYSSSNYQGKDMISQQKRIVQRMADASSDPSLSPMTRHIFRLTMNVMPRGGGGGDDIRMGILNIMRDNGIKEGHRPGIEDTFLAQWHQKLHSSTTRDDIAICEAYLHFLHTGNWDDFWWHLYEYGKLTKDDLGEMKVGWRMGGITGPACHLPHLIPAFQHYLWILKVSHSGQDLDTAFTMARGALDGDLQWKIEDMLSNRDEWWVPGKIVELRESLAAYFEAPGAPRDVALLDVALESFWRRRVESVDLDAMSDDDVCTMLEMALRNAAISKDAQMCSARALWSRVLQDVGDTTEARWSGAWALRAEAAVDYIGHALTDFMDTIFRVTQEPAAEIGKAAAVPEAYISNFGEEIVRGHPYYVMSAMVSRLRPRIRKAAGLSSWQVVSIGAPQSAVGIARATQLDTIQGEDYSSSPTVVLSASLGGLEDIPPGVNAVLTTSPVDVLSHIAIRARNTGVMLAACYDDAEWRDIVAVDGKTIAVTVDQGSVSVRATSEVNAAPVSSSSSLSSVPQKSLKLEAPVKKAAWVVRPSKYARGLVGGKSRGLADLLVDTNTLEGGVRVPASVALPYDVFDRCLAMDESARASYKAAVANLKQAGSPATVRRALRRIQAVVKSLVLPEALRAELGGIAGALSFSADDIDAGLWESITRVWASKWTERAYLSRKSCGIADDDLHMAVLIMDMVPADYAFVLHSVNPTSGRTDEVFGEMVVGLGETLVGNEPGSALSFLVSKTDGKVTILNLPSKLRAQFIATHADEGGGNAGVVIARSDSNGEDLEAFAGAGLYESHPVRPNVSMAVDYANERLFWDTSFIEATARRLCDIAVSVEKLAGAPQDIEGALCLNDTMPHPDIYLVQSRTQIV